MITIKINADQLVRSIDRMGKQVRFATAKALTQAAHAVRKEISAALPGDLDRPKPTTIKAVRVDRATKNDLTAVIRFTRRGEGVPAAEFLSHNVEGSVRPIKRSEIMLRAAGILPDGYVTAPGVGARLDAYGNMSRGQIVSILSYFRTFGITALNSPRMNRALKRSRGRKDAYFAVPPGGRMPAGVWIRTATRAIPVLMFVRPPKHRKLIRMADHAERALRRDWNRLFDAALRDALRTAR